QQFTEVAHLAEVARAGGQQALQPLQEHRAVSIAGSAPLRYAQLESEETTMTARTIKLALVQMRCDGTSRANLARALARVGEAGAAGASVVVLPELFLGPYFCCRPDDQSAFGRAEAVPHGPTTQALADAAGKHKVVLVGGSVFEKAGREFYNTTTVFNPDGA